MIRRIIEIDEAKCNGCGACAKACHEGAIGMVDGKAKLLRDDYCDGLGDCLPTCPTGAITFVEREAAAYDEAAVLAAKKQPGCSGGGCPGSSAKVLPYRAASAAPAKIESQLRQWPVQIKLAPIRAGWFDGLHCICIRKFPSGFYPGSCDAGWLPQAGQRRLFYQADGDSKAERYSLRDRGADGSAMLRRH